MKKLADATLLDNRIFLNSKKGTESVPAFSEPLYELNTNDTPVLIGKKVRECIEAFQSGNERYDREKWKKANEPLIRLSGEKSEKLFFTKVKYVPISLIENKLTFYPRVNHGWKEGFKKTKHPNIELDYTIATDEDLGKALLDRKSTRLNSSH